ncbi:kit ligand a isoform X2 [Odontesthes bonariensis]|uniref:kit ligand a isoform X2 n=1 Tax=Odontesthes bonariensis TaxID=219752 RepID=UPI003F58709E
MHAHTPKSWIRLCVHFLLFITLGVHSDTLDVNPVTDDISKLSILRENIPKDYEIPVKYIPKEKGGMCWVKLNVFPLEESLQDLANKFGNISSNRNDISIVIHILRELRYRMGPLDLIMYEFECHYRRERWQTEQYFDFVKDFLTAAQNKHDSDDCDAPPCPTTPQTVTTEEYLEGSPSPSNDGPECSADCASSYTQPRLLSKAVEQSLLSLLCIPLLALVFLLVWKVRSRRSREDRQQNRGEGEDFTEGKAPKDADTSKKNMLNDNEMV